MVKVQEAAGRYFVTSDAGQEIELSEDELLSLAQSARLLRDQVLRRRSRGAKAAAVPTAEIADVVLNTDLHKTAVVLSLIASNGAREGFVLPLETARQIAGLASILAHGLKYPMDDLDSVKAIAERLSPTTLSRAAGAIPPDIAATHLIDKIDGIAEQFSAIRPPKTDQ